MADFQYNALILTFFNKINLLFVLIILYICIIIFKTKNHENNKIN